PPPPPAQEEDKLAGAVMRRRSRRKASTPPAPGRAVTAPVDPSVEALVRHSLSDLDEIESRAGSAVRQFMPDPLPADADLDGMMEQARRKQRAGDFSGSLEIVERVLAAQPHHVQAQAYLSENTNRLLDMFRSRIGPLARMPRVKLRPDEIIWQSLDHRAGFLVSQVDGRTTFEDLIEISGMTELEATRMLARLVEFGIIG
ncbi:MAG: hypothetical protein KC549_15770, partial [Myxococcales bacterium]|nr:hypothetical protein [Myxococcales bacterium]